MKAAAEKNVRKAWHRQRQRATLEEKSLLHQHLKKTSREVSFEEQCRERWTKLIALPVKNCPFIFAKSERKSKRAGNACWYLLKNSCLLSTLGTEHLLMISIDPQIFWSQNSVYRPFNLSMCMHLFWSINHLNNPSVIQLMFINLQNRLQYYLQEKDLCYNLTHLSVLHLYHAFHSLLLFIHKLVRPLINSVTVFLPWSSITKSGIE